MNLAEGYLGRAPPDIVRSAMPNSFSSRSFYSGMDGAQLVMGPYEDNRTQPEEHRNGAGGTWPRQVQGHSYAKYPGSPLDNSTTLRPSTVLPSPRSRSSRFLSQSVESPLWSGDGRPHSARDPFASAPPPTITIQDFSAVPTPGFSQNTRHYPLAESQPGSFGVGPQNNKDAVRSPLMNNRRYGPSLQGPFYAISYDQPQSWNNTGGTGWGSQTVHHNSKGTGAETGTGECYTRVTRQLMRDSENFAIDELHPAKSQTRYTSEPRASSETNKSGKALLAFPLPGHNSSFTEENSRNPDNFGYASVNNIQHLWRNHINPSGSGDSRGFNRTPTQGYSSESCLPARLADNTSREFSSDGTYLDTNAGGRNCQPRSPHYSHDHRNFSDDRSVSQVDITLTNDHSFSQDYISHDDSFSRSGNLTHDRSFSDDVPFSDSRGTVAGKRILLNGEGGQLEDHLHRWMSPLDDTTTTSEPVKGQGSRSRFIKEMLSTNYVRRGNGRQEDLVGSGGLTETAPVEETKTATESGKAMMGQHRKWIQMEERLLIRIYELQKERSHLTTKVEEVTAENRNLARKFKDTADQLETKELEMENVRRQLREKIVDMTSTVFTSQVADSTLPSSSRRDAPSSSSNSSNQRCCHDDDVDVRRGRQLAQEELAACQIRFARERERWISEKIKVLRYQQLLQVKYEQVVAENQLLKEQVGKGFCENDTPIRSTPINQRLTLLKDGPSGRSLDSVC